MFFALKLKVANLKAKQNFRPTSYTPKYLSGQLKLITL